MKKMILDQYDLHCEFSQEKSSSSYSIENRLGKIVLSSIDAQKLIRAMLKQLAEDGTADGATIKAVDAFLEALAADDLGEPT